MKFYLITSKLLSFVLLVNYVNASAQTGPGGVGDSNTNKVWLRADRGIVNPVAGTPVEFWGDQSGNEFSARQNIHTRSPRYQSGGLNGLPYIHFDRNWGIQYFELTSVGIANLVSNSNSIFVVAKANSGALDGGENQFQSLITIPGYHSTIGFSGYPNTTGAYFYNFVGGAIPSPVPTTGLTKTASFAQNSWQLLTRIMTENTGGTSMTAFDNGVSMGAPAISSLQMTNYSADLLRIGAGFTSGLYNFGLNGDISEIIIYNQNLNETQRVLVENYLSSKYNHSISNDKYSYDGPGEFGNQVAGIGKTTSTDFHLSGASDRFYVSNPSAMDNGEYALLGHNNGANKFSTADAPAGLARLSRVWRVDIAGDIGTANISVDVQDIFIPFNQTFRILVDHDGIFSDASTYEGTILNGVFTANIPITLLKGDYISLGYTQTQLVAPTVLRYDPDRNTVVYGTSFSTLAPTVDDSGGPVSFSLQNAPSGLAIDPGTGVISFNALTTPLPLGVYSLNVLASNPQGTTMFIGIYSLTIVPFILAKLDYPSKTVSLGNALEPTFSNLPRTGIQYTIISGSLGGLNLNATTGEISGLLATEGTVSAVVKATAQNANVLGIPITTTVKFSAVGNSGPGGVGAAVTNKVWLDAHNLSNIGNGAALATFFDRSGNELNAVQPAVSRRPTYLQNIVNGKPSVRFDRSFTQYMELYPPDVVNNSNTIFAVAKAHTGGNDNSTDAYQSILTIPGYHSALSFMGYPNITSVYMLNYLGGSFPGSPPGGLSTVAPAVQSAWNLLTRKVTETSSTTLTGFLNGASMPAPPATDLSMTNYSSNLIRMGMANLSGSYRWGLNGDISEVIIYNVAINETQRIIIENYLAAKYNLVIANDLYNPGDLSYHLDVQAIGTLDGNNSNKHSIASNSKGLNLEEKNTSLNSGNEFLFSGHASAINALASTDLPQHVQQRWQRVWFLEKTGSIDAKLSFDISAAGLPVPANLANEFSNYQLLYRSSLTGIFSVVSAIPVLENGDQLSFNLSNAQLATGYYTLGTSLGIVWTGSQDQHWNNALNWSLNRVPTTIDRVTINNCTICPALDNNETVSALQLNNGSALYLVNHTLSITGVTTLSESRIESENGKLQSFDFSEMKNTIFHGAVTLEKVGGTSNWCYGGNVFSPEVKVINSSSATWTLASQANNIVQNH